MFILPKGTGEPVIRSSDLVLYFIQSGVVDSQIDPNNIQKSICRSKLKLLQSLNVRMKYIIDVGIFSDDWYFVIIPIPKWSYLIIYYLIG